VRQFTPGRADGSKIVQEPTIAEFAAAARRVLDRLPELFARELADVVIRVEEFASAEQLASVGMVDRWDLTGLYEGIPLPERSQAHSGTMPPVISLFRQPLLEEMEETGVGFDELVRHVVIHEAGHHFGFSDDDMHALEDAAED
jgi:predicted Zn-dependent protease with MMP-like domain